MPQKRKIKTIKKILRLALFLSGFFVLFVIGLFGYFAKDLPDPSHINQRQIIQSTKIYDRTGENIIYDIHAEEKRTVVLTSEIPDYLKQATVVIEDDNFYHHFGLEWRGILRAVWMNLKGQRIAQGGSTITQQYIKNAFLGGPQSERTLIRKIKEAILAIEIEAKYSKDEILSFYLNQISYGSNAYGVEAASRTYFNKSVKDLTLPESAILAALPKAPSYYSPFGAHQDELKTRQKYILERMVKFGYITKEQADQAKEEKVYFTLPNNTTALHFIAMVSEYLEQKYGNVYSDINTAGLRVYTTLDLDLQKLAETTVKEGALKNEKKYNATNAALVAIDPKTGQLLSLVGSRDYVENQYNVATSPNRQPGSSFKPFAYAAALKKGYTPETILFDLQTNFGSAGASDYIPNNYDNKFHGPLTLRQALAQSINIVSVKTLYLAGIDETINLAHQMGITTLNDRSRLGLSLVLGGGEIKLIDETAAYSVFANGGIKHPMHFILKIEDKNGKILEEEDKQTFRVLDEQIARQITSILSDNAARAPIFGANSNIYIPSIPTAAKTGTTQDFADGWTIGYTPNIVVGVWTGNNDFTKKMKRGADGVAVAGPIWNSFMRQAYEIKAVSKQTNVNQLAFTLPDQPENFTPPMPTPQTNKPILNGQIAWPRKIQIDRISGKLATDLTPPELITEKDYLEVHSILYYLDKNNPQGPSIQNPYDNPQFLNWETPILEWANNQNQSCNTADCPGYNQPLPTEYDDIHTPENQPNIVIISPQNNETINQNIITIQTQTAASLEIKQVEFYCNNRLIDTDTTAPYAITFNPLSFLNKNTTYQSLKAKIYDIALNKQEKEIIINYQP